MLVKKNKKVINSHYHYSKLCNRNSYWNEFIDYVFKRNRCITSLTGQRQNGYLSCIIYIQPLSIKKAPSNCFYCSFSTVFHSLFLNMCPINISLPSANIVCFNELLNTKITLKISTINDLRINKHWNTQKTQVTCN